MVAAQRAENRHDRERDGDREQHELGHLRAAVLCPLERSRSVFGPPRVRPRTDDRHKQLPRRRSDTYFERRPSLSVSSLRAAPLRAERERHARPIRKLLPYRGALGADAQRAVAMGRPVDDAEVAVRPGEGVAGDGEGVALQGGDDADGVFGFFFFAFGAFAGGCFACTLGFRFGLLYLFSGVFDGGGALGGFLGLLFFMFFGTLFGDGARGASGQFWDKVGQR